MDTIGCNGTVALITHNSISAMAPKCPYCQVEVVPNYRAKSRKHPVARASVYCPGCQTDGITCDGCDFIGCEWWYDLGMIWEDWYYSKGGYSYCQTCYYARPELWSDSDE